MGLCKPVVLATAVSVCLFVCLVAGADAAWAANTCQWTGAGADSKWSTAANWIDCGGGHPQSGDALYFLDGAAQPANENDIAGLSSSVILITGRGAAPAQAHWNITGAPLTITGGLAASSPPDNGGVGPAFLAPVTIGGTQSFFNASAGPNTADFQIGDVRLTTGFTLTFELDDSVRVTGVISGDGAIVKKGDGLLTLSNDGNTFTGSITITQGTLFANASHALGAGANKPNDSTHVQTGASLVFGNVVCDEYLFAEGGSIGTAQGAGATLTGDINVLVPPLPLLPALSGTLTIAGRISTLAPGSVVQTGGGTVRLSNPANQIPLYSIDSGKLLIVAQGALPSSAMVTVAASISGATLDLNGFDTTIGNFSGHAGGHVELGSRTLTITQSQADQFLGTIGGSGNIIKAGSADLTFAGLVSNTYAGTTTVQAGSLTLQKTGGAKAIAGPIVVNGTLTLAGDSQIENTAPMTVNASGLFLMNGHKQTIGSLAGSGSVQIGNGTLTTGANDTSTTFDGTIGGVHDTANPTRLVKVGDGTWTLTGRDAPTDRTVINRGTLIVDGSLNGSDVIAQGGTLGGTGLIFDTDGVNTFVSETTIGSGAISPGHSPGVLHADDVEIGSTATYVVELAGTSPGVGYDQLALTGNLTVDLGATLQVTRGVFAPSAGTKFTIVSVASGHSVTGTFNGLPEGGMLTIGGQKFGITYHGGAGSDVVLTALESPPALKYYLSEGATGGFFDEDILIANPNDVNAPLTLTFFKETGEQVMTTQTLPGRSQVTVHVDKIPGLEQTAVSTQVSSDQALPLIVERSMFWDASYYAGHTGSAVDAPSQDWLFAEGSQGFFQTFVLVINPNPTATTVTFTFFLENDAPVVKTVPLGATSRLTVDVGSFAELANRSFGISVHATQPIMAERSMYFGTTPTRLWSGGHESAGVTSASTHWFLAEGATGGFFDTFILLSNPNNTTASVTLQYLLDTGETITVPKTIAANARLTTNIEAEDDVRLHNAAVSTVVTSDVPIIAERSMYWPGAAVPWGEGHNSFGVVDSFTRWGLAEGRVGGPLNFHTYILLANPTANAANVTVTYLREGAAAVAKTYTVPPTSRYNIDASSVTELHEEGFGALIEVTNGVKIVVERSMYWDSNGFFWSGGTNATGTPLPF